MDKLPRAQSKISSGLPQSSISTQTINASGNIETLVPSMPTKKYILWTWTGWVELWAISEVESLRAPLAHHPFILPVIYKDVLVPAISLAILHTVHTAHDKISSAFLQPPSAHKPFMLMVTLGETLVFQCLQQTISVSCKQLKPTGRHEQGPFKALSVKKTTHLPAAWRHPHTFHASTKLFL